MSSDPRVLGHAHTADRHRKSGQKARLRALIALTLIVLWILAALTGFLLYVAPAGPHSGGLIMFILTKAQWANVHFWLSVAASLVTMMHIVIDWKALTGCVRFLTSVERKPMP
ncbi:DUF4405 domain-containing protein [Candidatus Chloroploca asiatica]|uniref:Flavinylation-associated cytochrome domain-containing protein n=1 Tax=Candidatus Chloroploca asiatica TaxID=1506545 RepID=A0A2H3KRS9_9CHLR|nr:DUF4405 domain-containing protein [Candidatus Chloroploca asiatica]PDW01335.1 hypothetical protein A9Q02_21060 [Candidatus Chloroploca asiatica]